MAKLKGANIAFIGLGSIGQHMADHLYHAGADIRAFNRTSKKLEAWIAQHPGAVAATSARDAVRDAEFVVTCVGDDNDLREIFLGEDRLTDGLRAGSCVIDHTTASDTVAVTIASAVAAAGSYFIDAPVSGGTEGAQNRTLSIMVGGTDEAFRQAKPILETYGGKINLIGPTGAGQLCKMVNQICLAGAVQGLADGLGLAATAGLDLDRVLQAINGGAAGSWVMTNRSSSMLTSEYPLGFAARLMLKDLRLCVAAAGQRGLALPVSLLIADRYEVVVKNGRGNEDFANIFELTESSPE
ncbi:MAG TPA: NAD(P)-dependent oxidoreductase [Streptosporangiaceae bacterium]|nr:NAD(P)-dependent oxidoreductase [Streptosporangiaceae bacterium]